MNIELNTNKTNDAETVEFNQIESYAELITAYCEQLRKDRKSIQEIKNAKSAWRSWLDSLKIHELAAIEEEFTTGFDKFAKEYIDNEFWRGIKRSTTASRLSHLRKIRFFYHKQLKITLLPKSFGRRLIFLIKANNYTVENFWKLFLQKDIFYSTFASWASGKFSPPRHRVWLVTKIEFYLKVPLGMLTATLITYRVTRNTEYSQIYNKHIIESRKHRYRIWTAKLQAEYDDFVYFKTAVTLPVGMTRTKNFKWSPAKNGEMSNSARIVINYLQSFFGFCCLPKTSANPMLRGLGLDKEDLSLSLLANAEMVEEYITSFLFHRAGKIFHSGTLRTLHLAISMLRNETGYLFQKPELAGQDTSRKTIAQWQKKCLQSRKRLLELVEYVEAEKKRGGESYGFGRDPKEHIKDILELPRPIYATLKMLNKMLEDVEKLEYQHTRQAILFRDAVLIAMLQANPLRVKMFSQMSLEENIFKKEDGSWWVKFKRNDFKNRNSLKSDYQVRLAPSLWRLIDRYVEEFRPKLRGCNSSDKFFLSSFNPTLKRQNYGLPPIILSNIVTNRTRQYIEDNYGFGPHAFRHIVATDIIKSNPEFGFFLAAKVLHDKLSTVEENYAHLKTSEFFEPYNRLFVNSWNTVVNPDFTAYSNIQDFTPNNIVQSGFHDETGGLNV